VIPESTDFGAHTATLSGGLSGAASGQFTVQALPFTGADGVVGLLGASLGLLLAGLLLLLAASKRRRRECPAG
jgi:hypothetical protein